MTLRLWGTSLRIWFSLVYWLKKNGYAGRQTDRRTGGYDRPMARFKNAKRIKTATLFPTNEVLAIKFLCQPYRSKLSCQSSFLTSFFSSMKRLLCPSAIPAAFCTGPYNFFNVNSLNLTWYLPDAVYLKLL